MRVDKRTMVLEMHLNKIFDQRKECHEIQHRGIIL